MTTKTTTAPTPTTAVNRRRAWTVTILLFVLMMINFADKAVLGLAATEIRREIHLTDQQYGLVSGGFFLLFSITALLGGVLADRFSTKKILFWMAILWSVCIAPLLGMVTFGVLLASRVALGAVEGPTFGIANHSMQKWFSDKDRNGPAALLEMGATVGVIIAAPVLTAVIATQGWRPAFAGLAVLGVVWAVIWLFVGKEGTIGTASAHSGEAGYQAEGASRLQGLKVPWRRLLVSGTFIGALVASFAAYWSMAVLLSWVPSYLEEALGYEKKQVGLLIVAPWLLAAVVLVIQGVVARRLMAAGRSAWIGRGLFGGVGLLISGVTTFVFASLTTGVVQFVFLTIAMSLSGMIFAISTTVCGELVPPQQRGTVLGLYVAIASLGAVLGPIVTGRIIGDAADLASGYQSAFTVMGVVLLIGGVAAVLLMRPERDAARLARFAKEN